MSRQWQDAGGAFVDEGVSGEWQNAGGSFVNNAAPAVVLRSTQVPGGPFLNETDVAQRQIPGWQFVNTFFGIALEIRYGRPVSDISAGSWLPSAGSDLFAMLDEDAPGDDSDYIYTSVASVTVQKCTSLDLAGMTTPRISIKVPTGFTASGTLTVQLWQGDPATGSLVAEIEEVDPAAGTYTHTLTSGEKAEITDGTDLYWRIEAIAN